MTRITFPHLRRHVSAAFVLAAAATGFVAGCGETTETKAKVEQSSPTGKTVEETTSKVKQTGNNPPPPSGATGTTAPR